MLPEFGNQIFPLGTVVEKIHPPKMGEFFVYPPVINSQANVANLLEDFYKSHPTTREKTSIFLSHVEKTFSKKDHQSFVKLAVDIATFAHQYNWRQKDQYRKEKRPKTGQLVPYIEHSIEIAERLLNINAPWYVIAAALLHDVAEDVYMGAGLSTPQEWLSWIASTFADTGKADLMIKIIDGLTEKPLPEKEEEREKIRNSLSYILFKRLLFERRIKGAKGHTPSATNPQQAIEEKIMTVIYNLHKLLKSALDEPETLWCLYIKICDIWQNAKTADWIKQEKILRLRIAGQLASIFGWLKMQSDIVKLAAQISDSIVTPFALDPPNANIVQIKDTDKLDLILTQLEQLAHPLIKILLKKLGIPIPDNLQYSVIWPLPQAADNRRWNNSTLSQPAIIARVDPELVKLIKYKFFAPETRKIPIVVVSYEENKPRLRLLCKFKITDNDMSLHNVISRRPGVNFRVTHLTQPPLTLTFQSNQPRITQFLIRLASGKPLLARDVPEMIFFHATLKNNPALWNFHLENLLAYLFEPNAPFVLKGKVIPVIYNHRLFFLPTNMNLKEFFEALGEKPPELLNLSNYDESKILKFIDKEDIKTNINLSLAELVKMLGGKHSHHILGRLIVIRGNEDG